MILGLVNPKIPKTDLTPTDDVEILWKERK